MNIAACEGWWEQDGLGRQAMDDLTICFDDGKIIGSGIDIIGAFTIDGLLDGERALLTKQYLHSHRVDYPGSFDGEGTLQGLWSIGGFGGKWMIRIARAEHSSDDIRDWP